MSRRQTPRPQQRQKAVSFDQLESSKENFQPLLRSAGKRMHSLAKNLQQAPKKLTEKQEKERKQWEGAIATDVSSDPLSLWLKYIKWTKLNFSSATNQKAQLLPLIERCTKKFQNDAKYTNSKKFIKVWLEYAHLSRDSLQIFDFMFNHKIGYKLALFWRGWAIIAENQNQFDLVDQIFVKAKEVNACPIKDINHAYDAFLKRMKRKISNQNQDVMNALHSNNNNNNHYRATLGQIGKNPSSHRLDSSKPRGFGQQISHKYNNGHHHHSNESFGVYCDEKENEQNNENKIGLPLVSNGWRALGSEYNRIKENNAIPSTWNNQGFGAQKIGNDASTQNNTFAIPMDDEFKGKKANNKKKKKKKNEIVFDPLCTHKAKAMGEWEQNGRYLCASFVDPKLLIFEEEECSLEEARCRVMKPVWIKQMNEMEQQNEENMMEEDDMMMTMNVGKILYNKPNYTDLSIPSTIKEEPKSTKSNINTDNNNGHQNNKKNRKRKTSEEYIMEQIVEEKEEPSKKRFKFDHNNNNNLQCSQQDHTITAEHTYDIFAECTTTNNTITSHFQTPLRRLDFATPAHVHAQQQHINNAEPTQDISSMTEFFNKPIKITDKRMADTPTVTQIKSRVYNATQTVTFHSKAAMNDIVQIFGANEAQMNSHQNDNNNNEQKDESFGIYEDTATIHTKIDVHNLNPTDDELDVNRLSINDDNMHCNDESVLPLAPIAESENDEDMNDLSQLQCVKGVMSMDPLDRHRMNEYNAMIIQKYINDNLIFDERTKESPVSIDALLNGETDIELDDDGDVYLNVTDFLKELSTEGQKFIFLVNDLSQDEDTERMLCVNLPCQMRAYHNSKMIEKSLSAHRRYLSMEYALVQSVYLYKDSSFTLSKINDNFQTLHDVLGKATEKNHDFDEKLLLYFVSEIVRIISQLHSINMIHCNLKLDSFCVKVSDVGLINGDWSNEFDKNGWNNFGLLLHDIDNCIKLDDFIDANEKSNTHFGCCIDQNNLSKNMLCCRFQTFVKNKTWCYEVDTFAIFIMIVQLLTHMNGEKEVMKYIDFSQDIMTQINAKRSENGFGALKNENIWNEILEMMLVREDTNDLPYQFDKLSICNRQKYLTECHEQCAMHLMDLENLSPKLQVILVRLYRMMRE